MASVRICVHSVQRMLRPKNRFFSLKTVQEVQSFVISKFRIHSTVGQNMYCHVTSRYHPQTLSRITFNGDGGGGGGRREGRQERYPNFKISFMFVPAVIKDFFGIDSSEETTPEQDLINRIKRCIYFKQIGETEKAERLLHIALKMAQDQRHEKGITYVYDIMANLAFENEEYEKARKLFVEVLKRLISKGLPQDDIVVVNISLKIADTFSALGDHEKGEQGFLFCLDTLRKKISAGAQDEDTHVLFCQSLDRYSLFLLQCGRLNEAVQQIESALDAAVSVFGHRNNKVGAILLSDMGVIKTAVGDKDAASQCFEEALKISEQEDVDSSLALIMVNRGLALKDIGANEESEYWCELGLKNALIEQNKVLQRAAQDCLSRKNKKPSSHYQT